MAIGKKVAMFWEAAPLPFLEQKPWHLGNSGATTLMHLVQGISLDTVRTKESVEMSRLDSSHHAVVILYNQH